MERPTLEEKQKTLLGKIVEKLTEKQKPQGPVDLLGVEPRSNNIN